MTVYLVEPYLYLSQALSGLLILDVSCNVSTVEIRFLVKGENLSGDSDTSLLDFAESGE
jgi:hypothetical protein